MKTCWIIGAGSFTNRDLRPLEGDLVIAADGGLVPLMKEGITPHILLGDFDSLPGGEAALPQHIERLTFPVEKDDTDTGLALRTGWERGYRRFMLYGCGGGRLDHLFANMQSMAGMTKKGASVTLIDPDYDLFCIKDATLALPARPAGTLVSVFCHGDRAEGVSISGLKYSLQNQTLTSDYPIGVSNHCTGDAAKVSVENGCLFVMVFLSQC